MGIFVRRGTVWCAQNYFLGLSTFARALTCKIRNNKIKKFTYSFEKILEEVFNIKTNYNILQANKS